LLSAQEGGRKSSGWGKKRHVSKSLQGNYSLLPDTRLLDVAPGSVQTLSNKFVGRVSTIAKGSTDDMATFVNSLSKNPENALKATTGKQHHQTLLDAATRFQESFEEFSAALSASVEFCSSCRVDELSQTDNDNTLGPCVEEEGEGGSQLDDGEDIDGAAEHDDERQEEMVVIPDDPLLDLNDEYGNMYLFTNLLAMGIQLETDSGKGEQLNEVLGAECDSMGKIL
jgi:hypothetical protein